MKVYVYKMKRDPLKSVPLEKPNVYCLSGNANTPCGEERQARHIATVPFEKHIYDCAPCKPACAEIATAGGTQIRGIYPCEGCITSTAGCISSSPGGGIKVLL